jgi:DNA-binding CsgD family transcriptional regulator
LESGSTWSDALARAGRLAPAEVWRSSLAGAVRSASNAVFATACTCPPGLSVAPLFATDPPAFNRVVEQIIGEFLPRVERAGEGTALVTGIGASAYAPLESARNKRLRNRFRRELLEPVGVNGLLNVFLLGRSREVIGWIAVGTRSSSSLAKRQFAEPLNEIAMAASSTLNSAIDLAASCGLVVPPAQGQLLLKLSEREREVARLAAGGHSSANVAALLSISEQTVTTYLRRIFIKVGVHSRAELAALIGNMLTLLPARPR